MKLKLKLPLAFGAILLLMLLAGLGGIYALNGALERFNTDVAASLERERTAREIDSQFKTQVQEWKNTLLRGSDTKQRERYWTAFGKIEAEVGTRTSALVGELPEGKARELAQQFLAAHQKMAQSYAAGFKAFEAANFDSAVGDKAVQGVDRDPSRLVRELSEQISADAHELQAAATKAGERATWISLMLMVGLAGLGLAWRSTWEVEAEGNDVKAVFKSPEGAVLGFALTGARAASPAVAALLAGGVVLVPAPIWRSHVSAAANLPAL